MVEIACVKPLQRCDKFHLLIGAEGVEAALVAPRDQAWQILDDHCFATQSWAFGAINTAGRDDRQTG